MKHSTHIKLYLAGKIGKNDWRHELVPGLRCHEWDDGPISTPLFDYVGPFFQSCDHGCLHGPNTHGALAGEGTCTEEITYTLEDIIRLNDEALSNADLLFVYITSADCLGTLVEIGRATLQPSTRMVIAFAPGINVADFWYSAKRADSVHTNISECCLQGILLLEILRTRQALDARRGSK